MFAAKEKQAPIKLKAGNLDAQGEKIVLDFFGRQVAKKVIAEVNDGDADPSDGELSHAAFYSEQC